MALHWKILFQIHYEISLDNWHKVEHQKVGTLCFNKWISKQLRKKYAAKFLSKVPHNSLSVLLLGAQPVHGN